MLSVYSRGAYAETCQKIINGNRNCKVPLCTNPDSLANQTEGTCEILEVMQQLTEYTSYITQSFNIKNFMQDFGSLSFLCFIKHSIT